MPSITDQSEVEDAHAQPYKGTTVDTSTLGTAPQRLRIHVPTANSELVLGLNDDGHLGVRARTDASIQRDGISIGDGVSAQGVNAQTSIALGVNEKGFVGVLSIADHGNIFLCATGAADLGSSYADALRAATIIETTIGVVRTGLMLWSATYHAGTAANLTAILGLGQTLWNGFNAVVSPLSGNSSSGMSNMDYLQTGHVGLFGSRSVKMDSIEGVSSSAALFNSHSAGLAASVNSLISATLNSGLLASVNGAYSASINGDNASVVGGQEAKLSSRVGKAWVEGRSVRIGSKRQAGSVSRYLTGVQEATQDLWMRANGYVEIAVPSTYDSSPTELDNTLYGNLAGLSKQPTGIQIMKGSVRIGTDKASHKVSNTVMSLAGRSVVRVNPDSVEIGRLVAMPVGLTNIAMGAVRKTYATTMAANEGLKNQFLSIWSLSWKVAAGVAIGAAAIVAAEEAGRAGGGAAGKDAAGKGGNQKKGEWVGETVGGIIGGVSMTLAVGLIAMRIAGKAQKLATQVAQATYETALAATALPEVASTTVNPLAGNITVKDGEVVIVCGTSQIKMTKTAVEIKALKVTVNDVEVGPGMVPAIPPPPEIPPPPSIPPPPPPELDVDAIPPPPPG